MTPRRPVTRHLGTDGPGMPSGPGVFVRRSGRLWQRMAPQVGVRLVRRVALETLAAFPAMPRGELTIILAGDRTLRRLNLRYRGADRPTNVLAFPDLPGGACLGDIFLACETVVREAQARAVPAEHHTAHLVAHAVLHLLGFRHDTPGDAAVMQAHESGIMGRMAIPDPWKEPPDER